MIETPRLVLEPSGPHLFDEIWAAIESSRAELKPWLHWASDTDPESSRSYMERAEREWREGRECHFSIRHEGKIAGNVSLMRVAETFRSSEIGYWMRTDLCGRGLMTEAASAAVSYGFDEMDLHRIELHAGLENVASIRVAEKLGFQREGISRDAGRGAEGFQDVYVYGLLDSDPRPTLHLPA